MADAGAPDALPCPTEQQQASRAAATRSCRPAGIFSIPPTSCQRRLPREAEELRQVLRGKERLLRCRPPGRMRPPPEEKSRPPCPQQGILTPKGRE